MTGQRVLFCSVAVDCIRSLLFSYLLLYNKLSKNATALNTIIYLSLILNLARRPWGWFTSAPCGQLGSLVQLYSAVSLARTGASMMASHSSGPLCIWPLIHSCWGKGAVPTPCQASVTREEGSDKPLALFLHFLSSIISSQRTDPVSFLALCLQCTV